MDRRSVCFHRPYWDNRVNYLDFAASLSISLNCMAMLYMNNENFVSKAGARSLQTILTVVHILIFIGIAGVFFATLVDMKFRRLSISVISNSVAASAVRLQRSMVLHREVVLEALMLTADSETRVGVKTAPPVLIEDFLRVAEMCPTDDRYALPEEGYEASKKERDFSGRRGISFACAFYGINKSKQ